MTPGDVVHARSIRALMENTLYRGWAEFRSTRRGDKSKRRFVFLYLGNCADEDYHPRIVLKALQALGWNPAPDLAAQIEADLAAYDARRAGKEVSIVE